MTTKGYTMKNTDKDYNYFLEKKNFYVSELHMGYDCKLESITDYKGPYNSLKKAQNAFKKYICADKFLNHWDFGIRGPMRTNKSRVSGNIPSIWYPDGTLKKYR